IDTIAGHSTIESLHDTTLCPPGKHSAFFQMLAPSTIDGGWDEKKHEVESKVLDVWSQYANNLTKDNINIITSETPLDIEHRIPCMKNGSIKHGDYNILQMGYYRPNDLCSETKTPVDGLYVCGASTYPGGLILGGPGYIAANRIAEDMGVEKWWTIPEKIKKYVEEYIE
ncbi:MAG: hypothetical protein GY857_15245, partial [Desulfobacula sp.]|nr:hypothetical protein [Desulfobacula sp.]